MYQLLFIARNNLKKKKSEVIILFFLIALAATLFYVSISVLLSTDKVLDKAHKEAHSPDLIFITGSKEIEKLTKIFTSQEEIEEFEITDCLFIQNAKYRSKEEQEKNELAFCLGAIEEERIISKIPAIDEKNKKMNSILLPYSLHAGGAYKIGDKIYLTLGTGEYEFEVLGFVEDPLFATAVNISAYKCYITQDYINKIMEKEGGLESSRYQEYKVRLKAGESSKAFDDKLSQILTKEVPDLSNYSNLGINWESMKSGDAMLSNIGMGIFLVFAILLILIALIIIRFSVRNFMEENFKNIAVLQAAGYTTKQLKLASVLEVLLITLVSLGIGLIAGYFCSGLVGNLQVFMMGLRWNQKFDWKSAIVTIHVVIFVTVTVTYFTSKIYEKTTVLDALRGGIRIHNFRKNYFSLEKSMLPQSLALGCKSIFGEKIKNVSIICIVMFLSLASCVGFSMYQNFALDTTNLLNLSGIELGLAMVTGDDLERIGKEVEKWDTIENVLFQNTSSITIYYGEKQVSVTCDMWKEPEKLKNEMLVEGRLPRHDNEIVLTTNVRNQLGVQTGDVVYVKGMGQSMDYIVSGIDQKISNMGLKALMTLEGSKRLNGQIQVTTLYIYVKDQYPFKELQDELLGQFSNIHVMDSEKQSAVSIASVSLGMKLICVVLVLITILVVSMVVVLLIKTKVTKERKNYGIYKALGYTTGQLVLQTILSNLPVIFLGTLLGSICSIFLTNPLVVACLSFSGIEKCNMVINPFWIILTMAGIMMVALVMSLICSIEIRFIEPVKMLTED